MDLTQILSEIDSDSIINKLDLDLESIKIPKLHSKYLRLQGEEKLALDKLNGSLDKLMRTKLEYYSGKSSAEVYRSAPFNIKVQKGELQVYIDSDEEISALKSAIALQELKVHILSDFVKGIHQRSFIIKNAIEWIKHLDGN